MSDCVVIALIAFIQVFLLWRHVLAIVKLTGDTGAQIELETEAVVRIRRMADSERDFHEAATRIDYAFTVYAKEEPDVVVKTVTTVQGGLTTLGKLTLPNAWPVWFNGKEAEGPFPIPASMKKDGIQSALTIGGKIQYVRNGPQEVRDVIAANQGKVLPLPPEAMRSAREANKVESSIASKGVWDADVPELQVPSLTQ